MAIQINDKMDQVKKAREAKKAQNRAHRARKAPSKAVVEPKAEVVPVEIDTIEDPRVVRACAVIDRAVKRGQQARREQRQQEACKPCTTSLGESGVLDGLKSHLKTSARERVEANWEDYKAKVYG